ncbi:MAG: NAD(P)-dependent glycerol-3-phosphate dehydrogenase [Rhodocyclaceae bacterium]|nr:NAD(P)-dependent glycerol-3-phosphate dehydrogenase [Rhodocyclaceae bacterium]
MRIGVFGAGAWGTALALAYCREHQVMLWSWHGDDIAELGRDRENRRYLPGVALPPALGLTADFEEAAADAALHLIVTPLSGLRATVRRLKRLAPGVPTLWACKGFEAESARLPHEIVHEELGSDAPCGALTGPSFAAEVARQMPTAITLASSQEGFAEHWIRLLHQPTLRLYANNDVVGAEVGGAVKNVMAIAAGICDGMGFGLNARAALITRGLAEMSRLGVALGGRQETFMGLAGMGDLILTCTGDLSRNRRVGLALAEGRTLDQILTDLGHVAEGVSTARVVGRLAERHGVEMPICEAVNAVLHEGSDARTAVADLLARDPRPE